MSILLYRLFIGLYQFSVGLIVPFNPKARLWLLGRKNILQRMQKEIKAADKIIWMHCASLGEFEQGRPVLEQLKALYPSYKILLTFFSPSGYEVQKNYNGADLVYYLPLDTKANARSFFDIVHPTLAIFVKYEFWYYFLQEAKNRNIPLLLISANFRKEQPFFKWYGNLHREMLAAFTYILVQNQQSIDLLASINFSKNVLLSGDTRFDRVVTIAERFEPIAAIEKFCESSEVLVAGSTWTDDDKELDHYANTRTNIKFIIAPHNISNLRLSECMRFYKNSILFSSLSEATVPAHINTLIIDNIGMLSRLYKYATVCFIGGGFGDDGVHNVLEAAVYGKPLVFGPEYDKYVEAEDLVECGAAQPVETALELEKVLDELFNKNSDYQQASEASYRYVQSNKGATATIVQFIQEKRLLTS